MPGVLVSPDTERRDQLAAAELQSRHRAVLRRHARRRSASSISPTPTRARKAGPPRSAASATSAAR